MAIPPTQSFISLLTVALLVLSGCASKNNSTSGMKVGMHIDAVLEFVVEYPLKWKKERRLEYGRNAGEIRWSPPAQSGTLLQISSRLRGNQTDEQELGRVLKEYPDLVETLREPIELPAGEAWHVNGQTTQHQVELYLFLQPDRAYAIAFKATPENFPDYNALRKKIILSFQIMTQQ